MFPIIENCCLPFRLLASLSPLNLRIRHLCSLMPPQPSLHSVVKYFGDLFCHVSSSSKCDVIINNVLIFPYENPCFLYVNGTHHYCTLLWNVVVVCDFPSVHGNMVFYVYPILEEPRFVFDTTLLVQFLDPHIFPV